MDHDTVNLLDSQLDEPAPVTYSVSPAQTGATPVFNSMPQPSSGGIMGRKHYNTKCVRGLCITIIVFSTICFLAQMVNIIGLQSEVALTGGISVGVSFYIFTAYIGISSAKSRTAILIKAFLVLSIMSILVSSSPLGMALLDISVFLEAHRHSYDIGITIAEGARITMGVVIGIVAIVNAVLLIISSGFACQALCCESYPSEAVVIPGQVQYVTGHDGQSQMVIIPLGGQHQPFAASSSMVLPYGRDWTSPEGADPGATAQAPPPEYRRQPSPPPEYKE